LVCGGGKFENIVVVLPELLLEGERAYFITKHFIGWLIKKYTFLFFIDAVHPTQATKVTSGRIKTGLDKLMKQLI
jgi:hypothetical protein